MSQLRPSSTIDKAALTAAWLAYVIWLCGAFGLDGPAAVGTLYAAVVTIYWRIWK